MIVDFLRTELAPSRARWRATGRVVVACVFATAVVMTFQMPNGYWVIITIFVMSQPNAGASLVRGFQRAIATLAGAGVAILAIVAFAQQPWFMVIALGAICGFGLFLARTSTAPYVGLLSAMTPAILIGLAGSDPQHGVTEGLWRGAAIALGVVIGTAAQLWVWPEDPEELLLEDLASTLLLSERELVRLADGGAPEDVDPKLREGAFQGLGRQLDWLSNAEALHLGLREKHGEQLVLIGAVHRLATAALGLGDLLATLERVSLPDVARPQLLHCIARSARMRTALKRTLPIPPPIAPVDDPTIDHAAGPALLEIERALDEMEDASGFLGVEGAHDRVLPKTPLDQGESPFFLTPAFSISNLPALRFALKGGLAASICFVIVEALHWPAIGTAIVTAVIVAQSSFGAMVQKATLRVVGAAVGGLLGAFTIVAFVPSMDTIASLLPVTAVATGIAAYVLAGSARTSYAGIQLGLAWALAVLTGLGPSVDLDEPLDRVIGILVGIAVGLAIFRFIWPELASVGMRSALASSLRQLASLSRVALPGDPTAALTRPSGGFRWAVTHDFIDAMRLAAESRLEPQTRNDVSRLEQEALVRVLYSAQANFLALLAVVRHRLNAGTLDSDTPSHAAFVAMGGALRPLLDAIAERVERGTEVAAPPIAPFLERATQAVAQLRDEATAGANVPALPQIEIRLQLYTSLVTHLERLESKSHQLVEVVQANPTPTW